MIIKTKESASWLIGAVAGVCTAVAMVVVKATWWVVLIASLLTFVGVSLFALWMIVKYVAYKLRPIYSMVLSRDIHTADIATELKDKKVDDVSTELSTWAEDNDREIARLKEGTDVVRTEEADGIQYQQVLKSDEFTYLPYTPRSFAYCSDTAPFEKLQEWIKGVDLLYHEGTFGDELKEMAQATLHSTASDAAKCAKEASVGKLVIGHYSSRYKSTDQLLAQAKAIFPNTYAAKEGAIFDVPLIKHQ
jgi:ribonuclease BN (tRNA processing enzyme)